MNEPFDELNAVLSDTRPDVIDALERDLSISPPAGLRSRVLDAALGRRPAGIAAGPVPEPLQPLGAFERSVETLDEVLRNLSDADWCRATELVYGRVKDVVAHLIGVEELFAGWLLETAGPVDDHVEGTRGTVESLADAAPDVLLARWRAASAAVIAAGRTADGARPLQMFNLPATVEGSFVLRTFEVWTHTEDVVRSIGARLDGLDDARAKMMSTYLLAALPIARTVNELPEVDVTVRFVLTGPGGGVHDQAFGPSPVASPVATIVAPALELCRLAANRYDLRDLVTDIAGDRALAGGILAVAGTFALD